MVVRVDATSATGEHAIPPSWLRPVRSKAILTREPDDDTSEEDEGICM